MNQRILVVLPHPDDEAFGMAGTLAQHAEAGARITYACLTLGEMGRNMGFPPFANRVTLPAIRKKELEASCAAIGIQDLRMMGFRDKTIEFEDKQLLDRRIAELFEEIKPTLVYTFYPGFSVHPDHDATGAAVIRVASKLRPADRPSVHCVAFAKNLEQSIGKPDVVRDVRGYLKQKLASIQAHRSQFQAAELLGSKKFDMKEMEERFGTERFWTFPFVDGPAR
jgi:bacillithiol biosynthesis deacetylase BshB2